MMAKKRAYNCLGRAKAWAKASRTLRFLLPASDYLWQDMEYRRMVGEAVAQLMREAYNAGFEAGYTEGRKNGREICK